MKTLKTWRVDTLHVEYWIEYTDTYRSRKVDGYSGSQHDEAWAAFKKIELIHDVISASLILVVRNANGVAFNKVTLAAWENVEVPL